MIIHISRPGSPVSLQMQTAHIGTSQRFPRWMWRNTAFEGFVEWLKSFNAARKAEIMGGSLRAGISQVRLLLSLGG